MLTQTNNLKPRLSPVNRTLAPGKGEGVAVAGRFLFVYAADGDIAVDFGNGAVILKVGDSITFEAEFNGFRIENRSDAENHVQLLVSTGVFDRKTVLTQIEGDVRISDVNVPYLVTSDDDWLVPAGGSPYIVAAPRADGRSVMIRSLPSNTAGVRVGGQNVARGRGMLILPGETLSLEIRGALLAVNESDTDDAVLCNLSTLANQD